MATAIRTRLRPHIAGPQRRGGPWQNLNFGNPFNTTRVNPDVMHGWGNRPFDWQGVWRYSRRFCRASLWTSRLTAGGGATSTSLTTRRSAPAIRPVHNRGAGSVGLPTAGQPLTFLKRNANGPGRPSNYRTFQRDYGDENYRGRDRFTANSRMRNGLGSRVASAQARDPRPLRRLGCTAQTRSDSRPRPQSMRLADELARSGTYTSPRSTCCQRHPDAQANTEPATIETGVATNGSGSRRYTAPSSAGPSAPAGWRCGPRRSTWYALLVFGDRVNSVDMRVSARSCVRPYARQPRIDLYNLLNSNVGRRSTRLRHDGALWLRPTAVLKPRFARFNVTFDF